MGRFIYVLPHIIGVYVVLLALIGSTLIASILITGLVALLFAYRLPQVDETVAEKVLNGGSNGMPIAHRGAALDAPENTLAAIKEVSIARWFYYRNAMFTKIKVTMATLQIGSLPWQRMLSLQ